MNDNNYQFLLLSKQNDKDSDFSEREYKNKDFILQKYEKFKPKNNYLSNNLKGAENKVKNLLSVVLKDIEKEKRNSFDIYKRDKSHKTKDNSKSLKKVKTMSNNSYIIRKNTFNNSLNLENRNKHIIDKLDMEQHYNNNQKNKVRFNVNSKSKDGINLYRKKTKKKNSLVDKNIYTKTSKSIKFRQKFSDLIKKTKSFSSDIFKRNRTGIRDKKKDNNIIIDINKSSKYLETNNQIKKTKSFYQNDTYLNFKNDILSKSNKDNNSFNIRNSLKKKRGILKKRKKNKIDILNESNHNSILSDYSDNNLKKQTYDIITISKDDESHIKEKRNSLLSIMSRNSSSIIKKHPTKIKTNENLDLSFKNSELFKSVSPRRIAHLKKILDIKKQKKSAFKRAETSINNNNINQKDGPSKILRFDTHFKSLKDQLKKSIVLRPEELEISLNNDDEFDNNNINNNTLISKKLNINNKNESKFKKMNSFIINNKNKNNQLMKEKKLSKSNKNLINFKSIKFELNKNLNDLKKTNTISNVNISNLIPESKNKEKIIRLESKKTLKSKKDSSKNTSFGDSFYSIKRKNTMYYEKFRILTHKKNVYDSLDDEEFEDEEEINSFYLDPNSTFTIIFDSILFLFTIITFIELPIYMAKSRNFCRNKKITFIFSINAISELLNILDLIFGFFRAYYNWEEQLINNYKMIAIKYIADWFFVDVLASIPFFIINKFYEPICKDKSLYYNNTVLNNFHYLLMCNKLLKVLKIFSHNQAWKLLSNKLNEYGNIIVYICLVIGSINYTACMYIFIARNSYPNWIFKSDLDSKPFSSIYICSIYILTMALTTVGYGDITCYSLPERLFLLLILNIGIIGYSWVVSFFSNYIKKINEKSVDYENKKSILDEIKISHPNLPDDLYDKILRYLKFKNFHEKKFKNIIFDCLPVGLKNDLISEMYKPIIQNFIFFKNFQNTDFIVRVILAFKPIIAYKNDILVNDGDMVEDIMFVKKGVLAVELPINIVDQQENIDKYLKGSLLTIENGPTLQKLGNNTILSGKNQNIKTFISSYKDQDLMQKNSLYKNSSFLNRSTIMKYSPTIQPRISLVERERKEREEMELQRKRDITYVKIIGIRDNEHFGDVLMFLEQRSPLRVRVRSTKCELFFLKKLDAINISTNYQNIWRSINKKSIFNYEQIKKIIKKIVEIYCSVKVNKSNNEEEIYGNNLKGIKKPNYDMDNSALKIIKEEIRISQSVDIPKVNYNNFFKNLKINDSIIIKDINIKKICVSERNLNRKIILNLSNSSNKNNFYLNSSNSSSALIPSSSSFKISNKNNNYKKKIKNKKSKKSKKNLFSDKRVKFGQKVVDVFNGNYKFYRGMTKANNEDKKVTIISEETDQDCTIDNGKGSTIRKYSKMSSMKNKLFSTIKMINKASSIKINNNAFSIINNIENEKEEEDESDSSFDDKEINKEILPGELINVNKEETLLNKKIDFDYLSTKQENSELNNNSIEYRNSKLQILLKSFEEDEKETHKDKIINGNIINEKSSEKYNSSINQNISKKYYSNKNVIYDDINVEESSIVSPINSKKENKNNWNYNISISNNISFQIGSSYANFNVISGEKLIKSKYLQNKLQNYLLEEVKNLSFCFKDSITLNIKKSLEDPIKLNDKKEFHFISPIKRKSSPIISQKTQSNDKILNLKYKETASQKLNHSFSVKEKINSKGKKEKNKFCTGIENQLTTKFLSHKNRKKSINQQDIFHKKLSNTKTISNNTNKIINNNFNYSTIDYQRKFKSKKNTSIINPLMKPKKKKETLLSQINLNIEKTNQNLNNPDEFYSNYFSTLLKKTSSRNGFLFSRFMTEKSKTKKEKTKNMNIVSPTNK